MAPGNDRILENKIANLERKVENLTNMVEVLQSTSGDMLETIRLLTDLTKMLSKESDDLREKFLKIIELESKRMDALRNMISSTQDLLVDHLEAHRAILKMRNPL